jgi:hypothetical protein
MTQITTQRQQQSHKLTQQFYVVKPYTRKHWDNDIQFIYHLREILHQPN